MDSKESGATALLHTMGFTYKEAKPVPAKANREAQELFIEAYRRLKSKGGKIYFADSTHPHHNAVISYGWIKKGEDFEILCNSEASKLDKTPSGPNLFISLASKKDFIIKINGSVSLSFETVPDALWMANFVKAMGDALEAFYDEIFCW